MRHLVRGGGGLRLAALAGVLAALALGAADAASAHTALLRASADARAVTLTFATPVPARLTEIDLLAAVGGEVATAQPFNPPGKPASVRLPVRGGLRDGTYFVRWETASEDGHVVAGVFDFDLDARAPAAAAAHQRAVTPRTAGDGWLALARIVQDAAVAVAFGLLVFLTAVLPHARVQAAAPALDARLRALLLAAALAGLVSAAVATGLQLDLLTTRAGACWIACGFLWLLMIPAIRLGDRPLLVGFAALLVVAPALRGHGGDGLLAPVVVVHVAAVSAWTGGLVALLVTASRARERPALFAAVVERFGAVALPCAIAVPLTGVVQALGSLDGLAALAGTGYGRLLVAKLALFGALIALAARNRGVLLARLRRRDLARARAAAAMRAAIVGELALAGLAITAAGVLAGMAPPA